MDELDWPVQSPDLNPIKTPLGCIRVETESQISVCDLTTVLLEEWSKTLWKAFPEELKLLKLQRVDQRHIIPDGLRMEFE